MNMKSTVTVKHFFDQYRRFSAAHRYLLGTERDGMVYGYFTDHISARWLSYDRQSSKRGGAQQLKCGIPAKEWDELIASGKAFPIGMSKAEMVAKHYGIKKDGGKNTNAGVCFENWAASHFCGIENRAKDAKGFYECGDMTYEGVEVQVKWGKATMCTLKTIHRLQAEARAKAVA